MYSLTMRLSVLIGMFATLFLPLLSVAAAPGTAEAASFVAKFNKIILFPTIALLSAVAFLVFLWGCAEYFFNAANETARQQGVRHIMWGIIGLVIMFSAFSILKIAATTVGLDDQLRCANNPSGSGCDSVFKLPSTPNGRVAPSSGYIPPDP